MTCQTCRDLVEAVGQLLAIVLAIGAGLALYAGGVALFCYSSWGWAAR